MYNNRFKTPIPNPGRYEYPSQPRYSFYSDPTIPHFQQNYFRPLNPGQPRYNQETANGHQQHLQQRSRSNTQKNQNPHQAKPNRSQEDNSTYLCPSCSQQFQFSARSNKNSGRVPLILNCEHTVCQDCIYKKIINLNVICPVCQKFSEISNRELLDNIQDVFPPNFYILGIIAWSNPQRNMQFSLVPAHVNKAQKKSPSTEQLTDLLEPEGEKCGYLPCFKKAVLRCEDCCDVFCVDCCTAVHKNVKSMWSHVQVQITNENFSAELEKCSEHGDMEVEFYCSTCEIGACCYCFIDKHEGHQKEYLSKLNNEESKEFNVYKEKAKQVLRQLLISQKKLKEIYNVDVSSISKKVCSYFTDLHGRLYLVQKKLLEELYNSRGTTNPDVANLNSSVQKSVKTWKSILAAAESGNVRKVNLREILQKLREVEETPCFLLNETANLGNPTEFCPDPALENLYGLFRIQQIGDYNLQLVSKSDLPPDYVEDPIDIQIEHELDNSSISTVLSKKGSNLDSKKSSPQPQSSRRKTKNSEQHWKKTNKKGFSDNELVEVTHIESLECFYVQLKKHQNLVTQMNKDIENYVKMGAVEVRSPKLNELYLAMYVTKTGKIWCRGRLTDIKDDDDEPLYEVYFIDYGSTQTLSISKLREIPPNLAQKKPFAIQCELYNPSFANWNKNAHVYMGKIINGKELYMVVKNVMNGVYEVDLMVACSDRGLTSIIDILIHTVSNALSSSSDSLSSGHRKDSYVSELKIFSNSVKFEKNQTEKVVLANVVDPHHIFVHIANYVDLLKTMVCEMRHHYKNKPSETVIPVEGSYVAVEHKDFIRGNWHRALVRKVDLLQGKAHVLLVDWGNTVVVPFSNVKMLSENFTRLESQAILVKLAHVEPYQGALGWSENATLFLERNLRCQEVLKMIVYRVDPLEVALFETPGPVNICINAQLVQEKFADSTGKISQTVEWPEGEQEELGFTEEEGLVASLLKKVGDSSDDDYEDDQEEAEACVKQQIKIVKVESPDAIYIKFLHLEQQEQDLYKELQIHYMKEGQIKVTWLENEPCVVQLPDYYVRGKIINKEGDKYRVNLYDTVTEDVLPVEKIYVYSDYFRKFPKFVFKCHLANIRPAGGDKWSLSSTEALERTFNKYKDVYATKMPGGLEKKSIPMLMWYTRVKTVDALEPSIVKYTSINKLLVKLGFAYKDVVKDEPKESNGGNEKSTPGGEAEKLNESVESAGSAGSVAKQNSTTDGSDKGTPGTSSDWNDLIEEENKLLGSKQDSPYHTIETEISDWKPAFPIKKTEFNAWITCAEKGGILYLRDEDLQPAYKDMELNLKQYFDSQLPVKEYKNWKPNQICTISYKDYWYRGKILKIVSPTEILAVMIDFGSDHVLSPKQLYREILYPEIPAFASKVQLDNVHPKTGEWIDSDYDTLLDIATEFARVVITGPLDDEIPLAEVFNDKEQSINELLIKMCSNLSRHPKNELENPDDEVAVIEEEAVLDLDDIIDNQVDTTSITFTVEPIPEEAFTGRIAMHIVCVPAYNKVVLKIVQESYDDLIAMNTEIQEACSAQPHLQDIEIGMSCICPYSDDGRWYRARIHNMEGVDCGYVFVFFVDFGNIESVSTENIKMMKRKWFELPVSCYIVDLNVELKMDNHLEHVLQHMQKLYSKNKLVHFVSKDPLVVDLYETNGDLCYQSLISKGLIKPKL